QHEVHLNELVGFFNTVILILSSVSVVMSLEADTVNKTGLAKIWMLVTFLLGASFLGIKAFEYKAKFAHGIYPFYPRGPIHERPDLYYGSAVRERVIKVLDQLEPGQVEEKKIL